MIGDIALVLIGLAGLVIGGDWLVKGAVNLALKLGIAPLIVGLTVVAFGTSAPELVVSLTALADHAPGMAVGNAVGSNIANVLLVLGAPALIAGGICCADNLRADFVAMIAASLLLIALAMGGQLAFWHGMALLAGLIAFLSRQIIVARRERNACDGALEGAEESATPRRIAQWLICGLIALPLGAHALVEGASEIARAAGLSETVIGLTLVAVGTSLPELATSIAAAMRGRADMALGNVLGSNIFNIGAILGITSLFGTLPVAPQMLQFDVWVMLLAALVLGPFLWWGKPLTRSVGVVFLAAYGAYIVSLL